MISILMVAVQALLSVGFILAMREAEWPEPYQAAGPAAALALALAMASVLKARLLSRILDAPVQGWRWPLIWAAGGATLIGWAFTTLPHSYEWVELAIGMPLIMIVFGVIVWTRGFTHDDRALFRLRKKDLEEPTLPTPSD
jgi:hypothetical protein